MGVVTQFSEYCLYISLALTLLMHFFDTVGASNILKILSSLALHDSLPNMTSVKAIKTNVVGHSRWKDQQLRQAVF